MTTNVTPVPPSCPTCGKQMKLTGYNPTCEGVVYNYVCRSDGDRLSWQPRPEKTGRHPQTAQIAQLITELRHPTQ